MPSSIALSQWNVETTTSTLAVGVSTVSLDTETSSIPRHLQAYTPFYIIKHQRTFSQMSTNLPSRSEFFASLETIPIESLPEDRRECMICHEPFGVTDDPDFPPCYPVRLACGHVMGKRCVIDWFKPINHDNPDRDSCFLDLKQLFTREERRWPLERDWIQERFEDTDEALADLTDFSRSRRPNYDREINALVRRGARRRNELINAIRDEHGRGRPIPWSREAFVNWEAWRPPQPEDGIPTPAQLAVRAILASLEHFCSNVDGADPLTGWILSPRAVFEETCDLAEVFIRHVFTDIVNEARTITQADRDMMCTRYISLARLFIASRIMKVMENHFTQVRRARLRYIHVREQANTVIFGQIWMLLATALFLLLRWFVLNCYDPVGIYGKIQAWSLLPQEMVGFLFFLLLVAFPSYPLMQQLSYEWHPFAMNQMVI